MDRKKSTEEEIADFIEKLQVIPTTIIEYPETEKIIKAYDFFRSITNEFASVDVDAIVRLIHTQEYGLHIIRLILDKSQDSFASEAYYYTGEAITWDALVKKVMRDQKYARELVRNMAQDETLNLLQRVIEGVRGDYSYFDIIKARFNQMQGRAIRAKKSGRYLEKMVEKALEELGYVKNRTYFHDSKAVFVVDRKETTTHKDVDYLIPSIRNPKVLIEVKAYTSTGSKQTDFAGDVIEKIVRDIPAKLRDKIRVFIVTDGASWRLRSSDLRNMFNYYEQGKIDGIFQLKTISKLKHAIKQFLGAEYTKTLFDY